MITLSAKIVFEENNEIELSGKRIVAFDGTLADRADFEMPTWGVISNGGSIKFLDRDNAIKNKASAITTSYKPKIYVSLYNTLTKAKMQIGEYFVEDWDYDINSIEVSATLTDGLKEMQDVTIEPLVYDLSRVGNTADKATVAYKHLQEQEAAKVFKLIALDNPIFDSATLEHLNKIEIPFLSIEQTNLWRALDDFGKAFQCHFYKNSQGNIVCVYHGGI